MDKEQVVALLKSIKDLANSSEFDSREELQVRLTLIDHDINVLIDWAERGCYCGCFGD